MAFSSAQSSESNNPIIVKLKKRQFISGKEESDLLNQLLLDVPQPLEIIWMLSDLNKRYQEVGQKLLEPYGKDPKVFSLLMNEIKSKGGVARKNIPRIIGKLAFPNLSKDLSDLIYSKEKDQRLIAIEILGSYPKWEEFISIYKTALKDADQEVRYTALQKLTLFTKNETVFLMLLPLIHEESDILRHLVLTKLAELDRTELVEPFFARLNQEPPDIQKILTIFIGRLARNPALRMEERLIPILADEDPASRNLAIQILIEMPNKREIIKKFLIYTRGVVVWLRERCFESFGKIASKIADDVIALLDDTDPTIRIESMFLAAYIHDPRIIPGVTRILKSDAEWWIRISAVEILGKFQTPDVSQLLHEYVNDDELQWSVLSVLGSVRDFSSIQVLLKFLKSPSKFIRLEVIKSLSQFPDLSALPIFIFPIAKKDPEADVRQAAIELLEKAGKKADIYEQVPVNITREKELTSLKKMGLEMEDIQFNFTEEALEPPPFSQESPPSNLTSLLSNNKPKP